MEKSTFEGSMIGDPNNIYDKHDHKPEFKMFEGYDYSKLYPKKVISLEESYGVIRSRITVRAANRIVKAKNIGIVICASKLSDKVKLIFKDTGITVYENIGYDRIKRLRETMNIKEDK